LLLSGTYRLETVLPVVGTAFKLEFEIEFATPAFVLTAERFAFPVAPPHPVNAIDAERITSRPNQRISFLL
jgi:hypothetical protein